MKETNKTNYRYIFGPVPSRRLGLSLGVDLVPYKTCTLDCIYCESGKTTCLTSEREQYVSVDGVIDELRTYLSTAPALDYITFSGAGEPLLNKGVGEIVKFIKSNYANYKIALLTNSTLFSRPEVINEVTDIDLIIASLDAATENTYKVINRPTTDVSLNDVINGLIELRNHFHNELWLEVFIVPGVNDTKDEIDKIDRIAGLIKADKIQLNSIDRPGTEDWVKPVNQQELLDISRLFKSAELISTIAINDSEFPVDQNVVEKIINLIKRRPCTIEDMSMSLGLKINELEPQISKLVESKMICKENMNRGEFYTIN